MKANIQVSAETRDRLLTLKAKKGDSYEDVIKKLLDEIKIDLSTRRRQALFGRMPFNGERPCFSK